MPCAVSMVNAPIAATAGLKFSIPLKKPFYFIILFAEKYTVASEATIGVLLK